MCNMENVNFTAMAQNWAKTNPVNTTAIALLIEQVYAEGRIAGMRESMARCLNGCVFEAVDRGRGDGSVMLVPPSGTVYTNSGKIVSLSPYGEDERLY